jgi:hypothetical protein
MRDLHDRTRRADGIADPVGIEAGIAGGPATAPRANADEERLRLIAIPCRCRSFT